MLQIAAARPPYIHFEARRVEKRRPGPPEGDGSIYGEMVDYVVITPQGSKDRIEKEVKDWFSAVGERVRMGMYPQEWFDRHQTAYQLWQEKKDIPLDGTPIKGWPLATLEEQERLLDLRIRTVEDLANANEETMRRLGMGAVTLKQRGVNFLQAQKDTGPLVSKFEALMANFEVLQKEVTAVREENRVLRAMKMSGAPAPDQLPDLQSRLAMAQQGPDVVDKILGGDEE